MLTAVVIGLGDRGNVYSEYARGHSAEFKLVAAADPDSERLELFASKHNLSPDKCFSSWEELLDQEKLGHIAIITTPDHLHVQPALYAMQKGYDVLLEKPMAPTLDECMQLVQQAQKSNCILHICHVLRYTEFYSQIYEIIRSHEIGDIVNISMQENVSYYHYAHSYIRGNWHNREQSSPMILAKCSHDLDLLYWYVGKTPTKVASFGALSHFGTENAPSDVPERCTDGCSIADTCQYYAPRIYLDIVPLLHETVKYGGRIEREIARWGLKYPKLKQIPPFSRIDQYTGWPVSVISNDLTFQGKLQALEKGPYGRCVYHIKDHNVVDHQVVIIEFENQVTATLTMQGHSHNEGRTIRIDGTKGTITGEFLMSKQKLQVHHTQSGTSRTILDKKSVSGHGGGDAGLIRAFLELIRNKLLGEKDFTPFTSASSSLMSHLLAFAADEARLKNCVVNPSSILQNRSL
jgi:predicted dehydrogenase